MCVLCEHRSDDLDGCVGRFHPVIGPHRPGTHLYGTDASWEMDGLAGRRNNSIDRHRKNLGLAEQLKCFCARVSFVYRTVQTVQLRPESGFLGAWRPDHEHDQCPGGGKSSTVAVQVPGAG